MNQEENIVQLRRSKPTRLLPLSDVKARTSMSRSSIYLLEARGEFPKRVRLSPARVAWVEEEVEAYIAAKVAARSAPNVGA